MRWLFLLGRVLFGMIFVSSGIMGHLMGAAGTAAYAASAGVPMAGLLVPLSGIMILAGGLMVILGFKPRIGAWLLLLFLIPTSFLMHAFWGITDQGMAQMQMAHFMKNLSLIGATLMFQSIERWPLSIKP